MEPGTHSWRMTIAAIACMVVLAACGGASTTDAEEAGSGAAASGGASGELSLVYWNWGPSAEELWSGVSDRFTAANPGVSVELTPVAGENWGTYLANTATLLAGGAEPDLIYVATEGMKFLVDNDIIMPVDDLVAGDPEAQAMLDDMAENLVDGMRVGEGLYALPYAWNNMVIYYNLERFEEAGVEPPAADWTWDDFVETAAALTEDTDGDGTPDRYGYVWTGSEFFPSVMPWVLNNGGDMLSEDRCSVTVDSPEVVEAIQFMQDMIYVDKVAAAPTDFGEIFNMFRNGDVAMFGGGRWPVASLVPEGFEAFDIQLYPQQEAQITEFGVGGFPILRTADDPELAWEFAKFASSAEVQRANLGTGENPNTDIPALRSVAEELNDMVPDNSELFYGSLDEGDASLVPAPIQFSEFESTVLRYTGLVWAGDLTAQEAMSKAQQELESIVSCP
jgi:multiple sugar transport system substrate-binding protein